MIPSMFSDLPGLGSGLIRLTQLSLGFAPFEPREGGGSLFGDAVQRMGLGSGTWPLPGAVSGAVGGGGVGSGVDVGDAGFLLIDGD